MRGFLNIDKPQGITSFDVVRQVRRAAHMKRVGHAGTLDPLATGVLPVALGDATRLVDELVGARKRYRAEILLGRETDTYDIEGQVTEERDASGVTEDAVRAALAPFTGTIMQTPPAYSAIKRGGEPAYKAARRGDPLTLEARPVVVYDLEIIALAQEGTVARLTLDIRCGQGFYVRSLAPDLGATLGTGGTIGALRRTQVGPFTADEAVPLDQAVARLEAGDLLGLLQPPDAVIVHLPRVSMDEDTIVRVRNGLSLRLDGLLAEDELAQAAQVRCYGPDGAFIGLLRPKGAEGLWHPFRVFPPDTIAPR
ncbi:MAG: tRNA pseudouridine(55) synthase TruB [Chloroflexi bacterium]|nr:tRNA pseudouridine(55) synthase TruB [Chloroflexota bacterium]